MYLKIKRAVKRRDVGLVWELLAPGYGLLTVSWNSYNSNYLHSRAMLLARSIRLFAPDKFHILRNAFLKLLWFAALFSIRQEQGKGGED